MLMNLNCRATEIVTVVQMAERYTGRMADPDDDRGEALAWYFRRLVQEELDAGVERKELLERLGIAKGHLSQLEHAKVGIGVPKLIQFAAAFRLTPGELLDRALAWWETKGRREREAVLLEQARATLKKSSESGEHPSQSPLKAAR